MRRLTANVLTLVCLLGPPVSAQQKGQWQLGSYGLNAGAIPSPGFTYQNLANYYLARRLNDESGRKISFVTGDYGYWMDVNQLQYVVKRKILGGFFMPSVDITLS